MKKLLFGLLLLTAHVSGAQAAIIEISVTQSGTDVLFTGTGSVDLVGLGAPSSFNDDVNRSQFNLFGGLRGASDIYDIDIPTFVPLNGGFFGFDAVSGDDFFVQGLNGDAPNFTGFLGVDSGYVSETAMSFVWTVQNQTITDLGLNFGTVAEFGHNTVSLIAGSQTVPAIPEPEIYAMLGIGLGIMGWAARRRKQQAA